MVKDMGGSDILHLPAGEVEASEEDLMDPAS